MKKVFIPIFCLFYFSFCSEGADRQTEPGYFSKIIDEKYSPNGKYKFTLGELNDSIYPSTQLLVDFDGCGGSVYNPRGWNLGIKVRWKSNDTIVVECKNSMDKMKRSFVQCFQNKVHIQYVIE